jgi:hypothetical protein
MIPSLISLKNLVSIFSPAQKHLAAAGQPAFPAMEWDGQFPDQFPSRAVVDSGRLQHAIPFGLGRGQQVWAMGTVDLGETTKTMLLILINNSYKN